MEGLVADPRELPCAHHREPRGALRGMSTMTTRLAVATVVAVGATAVLVVAASGSPSGPAAPGGGSARLGVGAAAVHRVDCRNRSTADFPTAFASRRNLVVGPLALMGARVRTSAATVKRFGGQKFPLLVRDGHAVTVRLGAGAPATARLLYGPHDDDDDAGHRAITFTACDRAEETPGRTSHADGGQPVTFWSGFVATDTPGCVPLEVTVDEETAPRRARIELGGACPAPIGRAPVRGCGSRAEGGQPFTTFASPGELVLGPVAFGNLEHVASASGLRPFRARVGYLVKGGLRVRAGTRATVVIAPEARSWVSLSYVARRLDRVADGDPAITFQACAEDVPAFSYDGPVGLVTGFAGGYILSRPGCVPLEVRVPGQAPVTALVPFGVGRCDAAA